jgi:hypothetical protein
MGGESEGRSDPERGDTEWQETSHGGWPRWPRRLTVAYVAAFTALLALVMALNIEADREARPGLAFLAPLIAALKTLAQPLHDYYVPTRAIAPAVAALLLLFLLFARVGWLHPRAVREPRSARATRWLLGLEVACLALVTLTLFVYRFYALNWIPNDNMGEMVFSVICTSDWPSMFAVNGGVALMAPWAPLGTFYFLFMSVLWRISGSTILTMRFAAAVSSILLSQSLYWFVRHLGGPLAALLAVSFYALSPVEMAWGRHDFFPFDYPGPVIVLLCASTYFAVTRFSIGYWIATAFLMGCAYHLFGSGYSAFLIPIGVVLWLVLFDRARLRRCGWRTLWVAAGLGLWSAGPALSHFFGTFEWKWTHPLDPRLGSRAFRGTGWSGSLDALRENAWLIFYRLYIGSTGDVHQTPVGLFGTVPGTYVSPLVTILFSVGIVWAFANRRRPAGPLLLSFVAAGMVPGLVSYADAHRQAAMFPALCATAGFIAAVGLRRFQARFFRLGTVVKVAFALLVLPVTFLRMGALYFVRPMAEPPSATVVRAIQQEEAPGTLLMLDLPYSLLIDTMYLLFDDSLKKDFAWRAVREVDWPLIAEKPDPDFNHLFYRHTALRHRVAELEKREWRRVVFVIHESLDPQTKVRLIEAKHPLVAVKQVDPQAWRPGNRLTVATILRDGGSDGR